MGRRIIIKTALICFGILLIINSLALMYIFKKYPPDTEKRITVAVAAADVKEGTVIEDRHVKMKVIPQSAASRTFVVNPSQVIGKKAAANMERDDYYSTGSLLNKSSWYAEDDRIIVLPVSIEERLANLIRKGSYVDIRLKPNSEAAENIVTLLSKVRVEDILDESGVSLDSKASVNSSTAYMKLILDSDERQKIYSAATEGKFIFELYCDEGQGAYAGR